VDVFVEYLFRCLQFTNKMAHVLFVGQPGIERQVEVGREKGHGTSRIIPNVLCMVCGEKTFACGRRIIKKMPEDVRRIYEELLGEDLDCFSCDCAVCLSQPRPAGSTGATLVTTEHGAYYDATPPPEPRICSRDYNRLVRASNLTSQLNNLKNDIARQGKKVHKMIISCEAETQTTDCWPRPRPNRPMDDHAVGCLSQGCLLGLQYWLISSHITLTHVA
jgi:hypothetical protein